MGIVLPAYADDPRPEEQYEPPRGITKKFSGEEYKCFNTSEWRTLGIIINDYRWFWVWSGIVLDRENERLKEISILTQQKEELKIALDRVNDNRQLLKDSVVGQQKALSKINQDFKKLQKKEWIRWGVTAVVAVLFGVYVVVDKSKE